MRIGFSRDDIDFVLAHYQELQAGIDPDPVSDESRGRTNRFRAPGITYCEVAAEISARVKLCGLDGMLVEETYGMVTGHPMPVGQIEKKRHILLYEIERRINRVKWFCVGRARKSEGYEAWRQRTKSFHHYRIAQ